MKYDDASWHYGGDFPKGLPDTAGATHIGMYLNWAFERGFVGELHLQDSLEELDNLKNRKMSGVEFLIDQCDEKLTDEEFSVEGNAFAAAYYDAQYLDDLETLLPDGCETVYHLPNTWETYDQIRALIDKRYGEWKDGKSGTWERTTSAEPIAPSRRAVALWAVFLSGIGAMAGGIFTSYGWLLVLGAAIACLPVLIYFLGSK